MKNIFVSAVSITALLALNPALADKKDIDDRKEAMMQIKEDRKERLE